MLSKLKPLICIPRLVKKLEGWSISMRLHNKDKEVKTTSLAWDVSLKNFPKSIYTEELSWDK